MLDVGCGWGSFALHAARATARSVVGITLSEPQARVARGSAAEAAGVADRVEIRVMDYRDLARRALRRDRQHRHGRARRRRADRRLRRAPSPALLEPGGRLLNHGIARLRHTDPEAGAVLRALRLPRRRPAAPLARPARARARRLRHPATSRSSPPTTRRRCATGRDASTSNLDEAVAPRRPGARARLAALPARRPQRLRVRLHLDLPGRCMRLGRRIRREIFSRFSQEKSAPAWRNSSTSSCRWRRRRPRSRRRGRP